MKKLFFGLITAVLVFIIPSCGTSSRMTKMTSTSVELGSTISYIPVIAAFEVNPNHVSATINSSEMVSLTTDQQKQLVVAKALGTVNGDVLVAPYFTTTKGSDGKVNSMTVTGYAATVSSFTNMTATNVTDKDTTKIQPYKNLSTAAVNTMTVAELEFDTKKTVSLTPQEMASLSEEAALVAARVKLLRQEKADYLWSEQYKISVNNGQINEFTLTAYPAKYVNYRTTNSNELLSLNPGNAPVVSYQTLTADIQTVGNRIQLKFGTGNANTSQNDLKEMARTAALQKYKADFLLNETFYFDYSNNVITHVTICGTPAVYANFRPIEQGDILDLKIVPLNIVGQETEEKPKGLLDNIFNIFKKK